MGSAFQDPVRAQNQNMVFMPNASRVQYSNPPFPFPSYQPENLDRFQNFNGKGAWFESVSNQVSNKFLYFYILVTLLNRIKFSFIFFK